MTVNKAILIGNLGADPETRTATSGTMVCHLRVATTEKVRDKDGNWVDQTEWHRVVCFGRTAENVSRFLRKGRQVFVEGRIQTRKWTDRDGNDKWTTEIVAYQVRFLGGAGGGGGGGAAGGEEGGGSYGGGGGGGGYGGGGGGGYGGDGYGGGGGPGVGGPGGAGGSTGGGGRGAGGGGYGGGGGGGYDEGGPPDEDIPF